MQNMQLSRKKITDEQWETCFVVLALEHLYFFDNQDDARKMQVCFISILEGVQRSDQCDLELQATSERAIRKKQEVPVFIFIPENDSNYI